MSSKAGSKTSTSKPSKSKPSKSKDSKPKPSKPKPTKPKPSEDESSEASTLQLFCAVYRPRSGNYYHWAFAIYVESTRTWRVYEVVQDEHDNFLPHFLRGDPTLSRRCRQPLTWLGDIHAGWSCTGTVRTIVIEIWDIVHECEMVNQAVHERGLECMMPFYGQDYGGQQEDEDEYADEEEEDDETSMQQFRSEEFVYDSDS